MSLICGSEAMLLYLWRWSLLLLTEASFVVLLVDGCSKYEALTHPNTLTKFFLLIIIFPYPMRASNVSLFFHELVNYDELWTLLVWLPMQLHACWVQVWLPRQFHAAKSNDPMNASIVFCCCSAAFFCELSICINIHTETHVYRMIV